MFSLRCVFCGNGNPAGAKFCNACAAPLHLKPCNECDAINDRSAQSCYKCGADFPIERATVAEAPNAVAPDHEEDSAGSTMGGFEQERQRSHRPAADPVDTVQRRVRRETPQLIAKEMEFFAHGRPLGAGMAASFPAPQRTPQIIPVRVRETRARRYLLIRVALPTLLVAAIPVVGYFGYRHQAQVDNGFNAKRGVRANADATRTPASVGVSPRSDGFGASSAAAGAAAPVMAPDVASPMTQGRIRTTATRRPDDEANGSADSAVATAPQAPKASAAQSHDKPLQMPARRSVAMPSGSTKSTSGFPDADALAVRAPIGSRRDDAVAADREPLRSCTEEVAALGLCTGRAAANGEMK